MNVYIVFCDIQENSPNYQKFFEALHSFPGYHQVSDTFWLVANEKTLNQTYDKIYRYCTPGDKFFVMALKEYRGILEANTKEWLAAVLSQSRPQD